MIRAVSRVDDPADEIEIEKQWNNRRVRSTDGYGVVWKLFNKGQHFASQRMSLFHRDRVEPELRAGVQPPESGQIR